MKQILSLLLLIYSIPSSANQFGFINRVSGITNNLAGSLTNLSGFIDGTKTSARFESPVSIATDIYGNIYVIDQYSSVLRKITPSGVVSTYLSSLPANTGTASFVVDSSGNAYFGQADSGTIAKVTPSGVITTFAGVQYAGYSSDGTGASAHFQYAGSLAIDSMNNLYVTDPYASNLKKVTTPGAVVTTLVSTSVGYKVASTPYGDIYYEDANYNIKKRTVGGVTSTVSSTVPDSISVDSNGIIYCIYGQSIKKIVNGVQSLLAGNISATGNKLGTSTTARFFYPAGIAVFSGRVFVTDNNSVKQITK
jgi:sugar lactone lactonase YvrE